MSLFGNCTQPGCNSVSSLRCTSQQEVRDFCPTHAGDFIYKRDIHLLPEKLNIHISSQDCTQIDRVNVNTLSDQIIAEIQEQKNCRIRELLNELTRVNQECLQQVANTIAASRTVQAELDAMSLHKKTPLNKPEHFADAVTKLKLQHMLNTAKLEETIQAWIRSSDLQVGNIDGDMDLTSPQSYPHVVQLAQPSQVQQASRRAAHPVIQLAWDKGSDAQTPKEAVEFLCRKNYVFDSVKIPEVTLDSLDLSNADLSGGVFIGTRFDNSNLQGARLENAILWNTSFRMCALASATVTSPTRTTNWSCMCMAYSRCGKYLAFGERSNYVDSLGFSPNSTYLVSGDSGSNVKVWDIATKQLHCQFKHSNRVYGIVFSPDAETFAAVSQSTQINIKVWNLVTKTEQKSWSGHSKAIVGLDWSSCGKYLVSGGQDGKIRVWNTASMTECMCFDEPTWTAGGCFCPVRFIPNTARLVSGGRDGTVKIWNIETGSCEVRYSAKNQWVQSIDVSPCGQYIVVADRNTNQVELYSMNGHLYTYHGHTSSWNCAAFSPCGKFIISGEYYDKKILTWVNWKKLEDDNLLQNGGDWAIKQYAQVTYDGAVVEGAVATTLRS